MLGRISGVAAAARSTGAGTRLCSTTQCLQRWRGLRLHAVQRRVPGWLPAAGAGATRFLSSSADGGDDNLGDDFGRWGFKSRDEVLRILAADRQVSQQMSFRYARTEIRARCLLAEIGDYGETSTRAHARARPRPRAHAFSYARTLRPLSLASSLPCLTHARSLALARSLLPSVSPPRSRSLSSLTCWYLLACAEARRHDALSFGAKS